MGFAQNPYNIQPLVDATVAGAVNSVKAKNGKNSAVFVINHDKKESAAPERGFVAIRVIRFFPSAETKFDFTTQQLINVFRNDEWVKSRTTKEKAPKYGPNFASNIDSWTAFTTKHPLMAFNGISWHAATEFGGYSSRDYSDLWNEKLDTKDFNKYVQIPTDRQYRLKFNAMLIGFKETSSHESIDPPGMKLDNMAGCSAAIISVRHPSLSRYFQTYFVRFED